MRPKPEDEAHEEIEATSEINLNLAERLRQAILKRAFSGRLVLSKQEVFRVNS